MKIKEDINGPFLPATKIKVVSAYSIIIDMLLQGGQLPFTLKPSPWDRVLYADLDEASQQQVDSAIDDQKALILQQFQDCFLDRQFMMGMMSGAMYGEAYFDRYVHKVNRPTWEQVSFAPQGLPDNGQYTRYQKIVRSNMAPAVEYFSVWDSFRDMSTNDIQNSVGFIRRQFTSAYKLRQKTKSPYFLKNKILRVIEEASNKQNDSADTSSLAPNLRNLQHRPDTIEMLQFQGRVPIKYVQEFTKDGDNKINQFSGLDYDNDGREIEMMVTMANDEVIRIAQMEPGERTIYRVPWEEKLDHAEGIGVADNVETMQTRVNGMWRAYEKNMNLSANVLLAVKEWKIEWDKILTEGGVIQMEHDLADIREAIQQVVIQNVGDPIINGLRLAERFLDEASMLPKIMQGETAEKKAPDTAYEMNQLLQNAGKYIGQVIKNWDERFIEPVAMDFLEYNMADPAQEKGKGNFIVEALGFTSFQDKVVRLQKLMQFINLAMTSDEMKAEIKFNEVNKEIAKGLDLDPDQIIKTQEEQQKDAEAEAHAQEQAKAEAEEMMVSQAQVEETIKENDFTREMQMEEFKQQGELELQELKALGAA